MVRIRRECDRDGVRKQDQIRKDKGALPGAVALATLATD